MPTGGAKSLDETHKDLGVPARDAQAILGHTRISTTLEIYTNVDAQARRDALTRLHGLLHETHS
jgi:site-specific recombinase XerD